MSIDVITQDSLGGALLAAYDSTGSLIDVDNREIGYCEHTFTIDSGLSGIAFVETTR